jgi:hypothetical protein
VTYWRRAPKKAWEPCARCNDPDGPKGHGAAVTPARLDGTRFGIDGRICHRCWTHLYEEERKAKRRAKTGVVRLSRLDREAA